MFLSNYFKITFLKVHYLFVQVFIQLLRIILPLAFLPLGVKKAKYRERQMRDWARKSRTDYERARLRLAANVGGRPLTEKLVDNFSRGSDTVFILGSGASLADISEGQWQEIGQHDSFGFNFSIIHQFIPTLYFVEGVKPEERYRCFLRHINEKQAFYQKIPVIVLYESWQHAGNNLSDLPSTVLEKLYWNVPTTLRGIDPDVLAQQIKQWDALQAQDKATPFIAHGGSVGMLLSAAVILGYKNIVLCGVDLVGKDCFWEVDERYKDQGPQNLETGNVHATVDPKSHYRKHSIPMDEYIMLFYEQCLKRHGINLYVSSNRSKLAEDFSVFEFQNKGN